MGLQCSEYDGRATLYEFPHFVGTNVNSIHWLTTTLGPLSLDPRGHWEELRYALQLPISQSPNSGSGVVGTSGSSRIALRES